MLIKPYIVQTFVLWGRSVLHTEQRSDPAAAAAATALCSSQHLSYLTSVLQIPGSFQINSGQL